MDITTILVLIAAAALLLYFLFRNGKNLVVYEDLNGAEILIDDEFKIKGKPDQVLKNRRFVTVIEVKSKFIQKKQRSPYPGDRMQLAASMKFAERHFGKVKGGHSVIPPFEFILKKPFHL